MTAAAVRPGTVSTTPEAPGTTASRAVSYQRVLHQMMRRELRLLAELATWAPADEPARTREIATHADLMSRVLLHHHAVERELIWPALLLSAPAGKDDEVRATHADWTASCARIDRMMRKAATGARQWAVSENCATRDGFAMSALDLADAVDEQTAAEERDMAPLLATYLHPEDWTAITRSARCRLSAEEQLLVLGLALEDASETNRARLLGGLPRSARLAWRLHGRRSYRATVVRLRGAPPAR